MLKISVFRDLYSKSDIKLKGENAKRIFTLNSKFDSEQNSLIPANPNMAGYT